MLVGNSVEAVTSGAGVLVVNPAGISLGLYPGVRIDGVVGEGPPTNFCRPCRDWRMGLGGFPSTEVGC